MSRAIKPIVKVQSPEPVDLPLADNDIFIPEGQDGGSEQSGEGSDEEAEDGDPPMPVQNQNPKVHASYSLPQRFSPLFLVCRVLD